MMSMFAWLICRQSWIQDCLRHCTAERFALYPEISYSLHLGCSYRLGDYVRVDSESKVSCHRRRNIAANPWY